MMTTAKEIMHTGAKCIGEHETLVAAAQYMRDLGVGALPICGDDDRLHGMITDRDIVTKCIAAGHDPNATTAGELAQGNTYHVDASASIAEMLNVEEHRSAACRSSIITGWWASSAKRTSRATYLNMQSFSS